MYLKREIVEGIAEKLHIDIVPVIGKFIIDEAVNYVKSNPKSTIGTANMEGLVCRPVADVKDRRGNRIIVKVKVCNY